MQSIGDDTSLIVSPAKTAAAGVAWRYASWAEIDRELAGCPTTWISQRERAELAQWRHAARRRAWLGGRMLSKRLVQANLTNHVDLGRIEVIASDRGGPRVYCGDRRWAGSLSISHTERGVLVALSRVPGTSIGVDMTSLWSPTAGFVRLWYSSGEVGWLRGGDRALRASTLWAAKEALYKACNSGESFDARQCEILPQFCRYRRHRRDDVVLRQWTGDGQVAVLALAGGPAANVPARHSATSRTNSSGTR